jgi:hypothetical protein
MAAFTKARVKAQCDTQSAMQSVNVSSVRDGEEELTLKQHEYECIGLGQASHIRFNLQSGIER